MHVSKYLLAAGLVLAPLSAQAALIDFTTLQTNGSATATATDLSLTDGLGGEAGSAFLGAVSSHSTFSTSFKLTLTGNPNNPACCNSPIADGITFIVQGNGQGALGTGGGGVGADGIGNSVGLALRSWDNNHATLFTNGNVYGGAPLGNFNLGDQDDVVLVSLSYAAGVLNYTATNISTSQVISDSMNFDLTTLGSNVFFGFTGGTGLGYAFQDITDWDLTVTPNAAVPEPTTWALMLAGFGLAGGALRRRQVATIS